MKKITFYLSAFLLFSFLLFSFSPFSLHAQQQQLPDSDFETSWVSKTGGDGLQYWDYKTQFFCTLNSLRGVPELADLTAYRDNTNVQSGQYCIKLVSGGVTVGSRVFLPGMVGTINPKFIEEFLNPSSGGGVTITRDWAYDTPHSLEGWYKYVPTLGDSASIDIGFSNYDEEIFVEKMVITNAVPGWTHFVIPIPEKYRNDFFNRIRVLFVASAGVNFQKLMECKGQEGSILWIDNIHLNYNLGIKQNLFSTLNANAFPNPATEVLNIELNENFLGKISVYNMAGSVVMEENINGTECQLNTSNLSTGNYIYRLMDGNTIFAQGKFVVTK